MNQVARSSKCAAAEATEPSDRVASLMKQLEAQRKQVEALHKRLAYNDRPNERFAAAAAGGGWWWCLQLLLPVAGCCCCLLLLLRSQLGRQSINQPVCLSLTHSLTIATAATSVLERMLCRDPRVVEYVRHAKTRRITEMKRSGNLVAKASELQVQTRSD